MAPKRVRFTSSEDDVALALSAVVDKWSFLKYPTSLKAKPDKKTLVETRLIWVTLQTCQQNLCFSQQTMVNIMLKLAELGQWRHPPQNLQEWANVMASRVRAGCRHIQQSRRRSPPAKFIKEIFLPGDSQSQDSATLEGGADSISEQISQNWPDQPLNFSSG